MNNSAPYVRSFSIESAEHASEIAANLGSAYKVEVSKDGKDAVITTTCDDRDPTLKTDTILHVMRDTGAAAKRYIQRQR